MDSSAQYIATEPKHKFAMGLDPEAKALLVSMSKPYFQREKQAMAGPPAQRRGGTDPHAPASEIAIDDGRMIVNCIEQPMNAAET